MIWEKLLNSYVYFLYRAPKLVSGQGDLLSLQSDDQRMPFVEKDIDSWNMFLVYLIRKDRNKNHKQKKLFMDIGLVAYLGRHMIAINGCM